MAIPVAVGRRKSLALIKAAQKSKTPIGVVCQKDASEEDPDQDGLYSIGVVADIVKILEFPDDTTNVVQGKVLVKDRRGKEHAALSMLLNLVKEGDVWLVDYRADLF